MFGDKQFRENAGYPTPESLPETSSCLILQIPANAAWWAVYTGLLFTLCEESAWQQFEGGMTRADAAAAAQAIWDDAMQLALGESCATSVPAPYWDDSENADDELPIDDQVWYGEVTNPEAAPESLTFVENAGIWVITGFIAYSGAIGAAITFHTIAPRFVLAWKKGDIGEIFRVVIDANDAAMVDTDDFDTDIIEVPMTPEASELGHDITIVKVA